MDGKRLSAAWLALALCATAPPASDAGPPAAHMKEYAITFDATALVPPTRWQVPGITPMILTLDPESTEAYRSTEKRTLQLKPGAYKFGTYTFDFPFHVTLEGRLEFDRSLDQCVTGRQTQTLTITCSRTYPYGGKPDYEYK
jgi:hypothetical protein